MEYDHQALNVNPNTNCFLDVYNEGSLCVFRHLKESSYVQREAGTDDWLYSITKPASQLVKKTGITPSKLVKLHQYRATRRRLATF